MVTRAHQTSPSSPLTDWSSYCESRSRRALLRTCPCMGHHSPLILGLYPGLHSLLPGLYQGAPMACHPSIVMCFASAAAMWQRSCPQVAVTTFNEGVGLLDWPKSLAKRLGWQPWATFRSSGVTQMGLPGLDAEGPCTKSFPRKMWLLYCA